MPNFSINKKKFSRKDAPEFTFVNVSDVYPFNDIENYKKYQPGVNEKPVFSAISCLNFKPYQFEAYDIQARKNMDSVKLKIKVYTKPDH